MQKVYMYKRVANTEVPYGVLFRALVYTYIYPKNGFYKKLRERFGYRAKVVTNTELGVKLILGNVHGSFPGMKVGVDGRLYKRLQKLITSQGYGAVEIASHKDLLAISEDTRCLAIIVTDGYAAMTARQKKRLYSSNVTTIVIQRRKQPKSVDLDMDAYIWEPKQMPKAISCSVVVLTDALEYVREAITAFNRNHQSPTKHQVLREIYYAVRGRINTYRRLDQRPSALMVRLVYDFYKGQMN